MRAEELLLSSQVKQNIPTRLLDILERFLVDYISAMQSINIKEEEYLPNLVSFIRLIENELDSPFAFEPYHEKITTPFNHYQFGLDLIRPLVDLKKSSVQGLSYLNEIANLIESGDNVILFSNHQTEPDPQCLCLLVEKTHPKLAEELIFVAGHRVTTDPLAIPLSKGLNLLCIYSKKRMEHPPEEKAQKLLHNQRTMQKMSELLDAGGKCIWVAPSGGRDRQSASQVIEVAPFDPQSIELFRIFGEKAKAKTHFYPLSLSTYDLLPPPSSIDNELGEGRFPKSSPIHLYFGSAIDMKKEEGQTSKAEAKKERAFRIWQIVKDNYSMLLK